MTDPTPAAGAPETRWLTPEEAIRRAAVYVLQLSNSDIRDHLGPMFGEAMLRALAQDGFALATAPEPSLLAAVEALRQTLVLVPPQAGRHGMLVAPGKGRAFEIAAWNLIAALDRSRSTSREAGLDAERLARALWAAEGKLDWRGDGISVAADALILAAEYARLAASPVTEEPS